MFVLTSYTFTVLSSHRIEIVVPGVYGIERFVSIENATSNDILYSSIGEHIGSIEVSNDGVSTTLLVECGDWGAEATDLLRIVVIPLEGGGVGPSSNVAVTNWPAAQNVYGTVSVGNFPANQDVTVTNFPTTQEVTQGTTPWVVDGTATVTGDVSVNNFPVTQEVTQGTNPWTVDGTVNIGNLPASQLVTQGTTPWVVSGTVTSNSTVTSFPTTSTDAFGRMRVSDPYTLFDSSNRYALNESWTSSLTSGGTTSFNSAQGLVDLNVTATPGSSVVRETTRVFAYQPGKSLLVFSTFVMNGGAGYNQKVGYYGASNGFYLERDAAEGISLVERSLVTGIVTNTPVPQASWNVDPMNGTGPSGISLDFTKSQILWFDIEWLGVGTVRAGFVVDGQFILAHRFNHANILASTYITTACLPLRYEIENVSAGSGATLKQICSTVISEGGYTLNGTQRSASTPITTPSSLATAGVYYPVISLRLKSLKLDAIALLTGLSLLGAGNNETYSWRVVSRATTSGGAWSTLSANSSVEYNLTGTSVTGGNVIASGFTSASNQGSPVIDFFRGSIFSNQLERDGLTGTPYELVIEVAGAGASQLIYAAADWEEVTS